jgi:type II secretory pathway pseudopilin PulG
MKNRNKRKARRDGYGIIELFVIIGIIAFLIAVLVPAVAKVREAATRTQSINNLKQIGLAFHSFYDNYKRLPGNGGNVVGNNIKYKADAEGKNPDSGSWAFMILPYLDQQPTFDKVDRTREIAVYMCPGRGRPALETSNGGGAWTDYFYNNYMAKDPAKPDSYPKYKLSNIPDGSSNTIMVGHGNIDTTQYKSTKDVTLSTNIFKGGTTGTMRSGNDIGKGNDKMGAVTLAPDSDTAPTIGSWGGPFRGVTLVSMYDGSVRAVSYSCSVTTFRIALMPDDGGVLGGDFD